MTTNDDIFKSPEAFQAALAQAEQAPFPTSESEKTTPEDVVAIETVSETPLEAPTEENASLEHPDAIDTPDTTETQGKTHLIPKSRFNEEATKRKSAEEQLQKEREENIRMKAQWDLLSKMQEQQKADNIQPEPEIDPLDVDAFNHTKREIQNLKNELAEVRKYSAENTQKMQYSNIAQVQENAFVKEHPDFYNAIEYVKNIETNVAKNFSTDEAQAKMYAEQKLQSILVGTLNNGKNAAEALYNMAKSYGYQDRDAPVSNTSPNKPTVNVDNINKNMERSASIQNLNSSATVGAIPSDIQAALDEKGHFVQAKWDAMMTKQKRNAGF
jgi:hypothetical protein